MSSERSPTSERRDEFLTVAEIAERLKVNQQSVRNWIDGGLLAAVRVGVLPLTLVSNVKSSLDR